VSGPALRAFPPASGPALRAFPPASGPALRAFPPASGLALRAFPLLRAGYGAVLLCAPGALIGVCTGQPPSRLARRTARVLGIRHLSQAVITAREPSSLVLAGGALVDLAHAASMLALAAGDRPARRAEIADGLIATAFAGAGAALRSVTR
jgi:hypothetical protein